MTIILATTILFLAIKPGIDTLSLQTDTEQSCCGGQCTSDNDNSQDENQENDCNGKSCNPFQVCGSCVLACLTLPFEYLPKQTVSTKETFAYQSAFASQFASDFWQPPKIV
ncbi:MAG: hypothetical protein LC111_11180 [Bacteroidia bacterium]|nr:hypothetical protein [Bacteroidia bacterium]